MAGFKDNIKPSDKFDIASMTEAQKKKYLFEMQKHTLDSFLQRGAITKAQYDKSLRDLIAKMKF